MRMWASFKKKCVGGLVKKIKCAASADYMIYLLIKYYIVNIRNLIVHESECMKPYSNPACTLNCSLNYSNIIIKLSRGQSGCVRMQWLT